MGKDLRTFVRDVLTHHPGDIKVVDRPVDSQWGITAWGAEYDRRDEYPAFLFTNVAGAELPCITNLVATFERMAVALALILISGLTAASWIV